MATGRPAALYPRLSAMMFLQFAIWGAWSVLLFLWLFSEGRYRETADALAKRAPIA